MKNLRLSWEVTSSLKLQSNDDSLQFAAFDIERNRLFFASSANLIYTILLPSSLHDHAVWRSSSLPLAVKSVDMEPGDFITSFDYLMEKEALIIGTSSGLMLLYHVEDNVTETVGKVEGGVMSISPSPDGDLLAVSTGFGQLLVMTYDWDLLYEITVFDDLPADDDVCGSSFSSINSIKSLISWRGDGKYFATLSSVQNSSACTKIKVWERDSGILHSVSEPKPFMNSILEWMPSGAKIAAVSNLKAEKRPPSIVFYERNGLERSSFSTSDEIDSTLEFLKWNCNSDLIASIVRCQEYDSLSIWFFSNNHWYLKQEVRYPKQDMIKFMWNPTKPLQLICWTLSGQITVFNFIWVTSVTANSISLVIDGSEVLVTPLSLSLMPPPMFLFKLKFPSAVRDIAFCCKSPRNLLAASLSSGHLCVAELPQLDTLEEFEGKEFCVEASYSESELGCFTHLEWLDSHVLLGATHFGFRHSSRLPMVTSGENELSGYYLQELEITCFEDHVLGLVTCSGWNSKICNKILLDEPLICIVTNPSARCSAFVQLDGGKLFEYTSKLCSPAGAHCSRLQILEKLAFSSSCPWMCVVPICDVSSLKFLPFGLDDNGRLHVNGRIICNNCSSFSFYSNSTDQLISHLILATKHDLLFIVEIGDILQEKLEAKYDAFVPVMKKRNEEDKRNSINIWEKGAKIVGVLHGDEAAVVVQTNRGNLECIYPRKLVLSSIINALIERRFMDALSMVRRHRIDFNVIIDHCGWQAFLDLAPEFVRQINNLSYITEFICSIKTEDIMETLYKNYVSVPCLQESKENKNCVSSDSSTKISAVLMAIRKALDEQVVESPARELCILTTLARSDPPALEEALKRIKVIREMELLGSDDPKKTSYPSAEEALKHLLWLSDSEAVYEAALGLYDLNLTAIVALNSQRDPREFIPFLEDLKRMPTLLMKYNIDIKLKRYHDALRHIIMAGEAYYVDCMDLMKNYPELFPLGLELTFDDSKRRQVLEAWGDHLCNIKAFEDAAATYLCCQCLEKALKAYRGSGNWCGVLTVAGLIRLGKEEVMQLAHELCEELQALGKPVESARIALEYCGDVNRGINLLVSAREWEEALRVAFMHRRDDLISEVRDSSLECASGLIEDFKEGLEKVGKYLARYLAVRQRRLLLVAKLQSDGRSANEFDDDTASETSSSFSGMSAYTTGTRKDSAVSVASSSPSKPRERRRQRNKGKIRAGSPDEEMALVEHMKGMSLTVGARRELKSLLLCLVMLGKEAIARKLQVIGQNFQISQFAAVKLAEDAMSSGVINEQAHSLDNYVQKVKQELEQHSDDFSWQVKVLISP